MPLPQDIRPVFQDIQDTLVRSEAGHDAEGGFTKGFADNGGQIVGTTRIPLAQLDFVPILQRVKDARPDSVFIFVPAGKYATAVMKAWSDLGLKDAGIQLVTTQDVMLDEELPNMGDIPLGIRRSRR